tara:strand:+ start:4157 stop:4576 length:420 start_codon:yes stop_codon:yes gene_type:complete
MDLVMEETQDFKRASSAIKHIKELSHKNFTREICGFLGYDRNLKKYIVQLENNIAHDPSSFFLIDPLNYLLFKDKYAMIAVFHSHVVGNEDESEFDIKMADNCCHPFLIYSLNTKKINIYTPKNSEVDVNKLERIKAAL